MRVIERIRRAICEQRYRISSHANEEMSKDELEAKDIERVILTGKVARKFTRDPRGTRYEVVGSTTDDRRDHVICSFLLSGVLLIITAFAEGDKK